MWYGSSNNASAIIQPHQGIDTNVLLVDLVVGKSGSEYLGYNTSLTTNGCTIWLST